MCKEKVKEFRDTETLIIMLLLLSLVILSDVFVTKETERRDRNNRTEEKDGNKKQLKRHG